MTRDAKATGLCRKHGFSDATFYKWKARHGGLEGSGAKRLKAPEDENSRLKRLLADAILDNAALIAIVGKRGPPDARRPDIAGTFWP